MVVLDALGAEELGRVITTFRDGLRSHQELINRLNVYPVPDGDTGTNMALTMESVTEEIAGLDAPDLDATCRAIAHGSLMGARGNSGVILSQLLRGLSEGLNCPTGHPGPVELSEALTIADKLAREAVMRPVEGTILTVARGAAEGARRRGRCRRPAGRGGRGVAGRGGRGAGPDARRCCPCWSRPAWSTPAVPGSSCCSTPCSPWWTAGPCRIPPTSPRRCSAPSTPRRPAPRPP